MKTSGWVFLVVTGVLLGGAGTQAADPGKGYFGAVAGIGIPAGLDGLDAGFSAGGVLGYRFTPQLAGDLAFVYTGPGTGVEGLSLNINQLLLGISYFLPNNRLRIGGHLGPVFESALGLSETEFGFGTRIGYDYPVADQLTLGLEANWTLVLGDPETYHMISFLVPIRVWF